MKKLKDLMKSCAKREVPSLSGGSPDLSHVFPEGEGELMYDVQGTDTEVEWWHLAYLDGVWKLTASDTR